MLDFLRDTLNVTYFKKIDSQTYPVFLEELKDAQGILGSRLKVDQELLGQAPNLKIVCNTSVGYDNLDLSALAEHGVIATNTPDILNDTVADTIFGLILSTARRIPELDQWVKTGQWKSTLEEKWFGVDVHHKVLGIIGMGRVGTAIAKRAYSGFDMQILYHNRSRNEEAELKYNATYCTLDDLLKQSDFVCLMTPLTPQTEKLIGQREFELMKETAIFINGSRGKTVDEQALIQALKTREILGAGLDVFVQEPMDKDHPLLTMNNVVTLPHIGFATYETRFNMDMMGAVNLVAGLQGEVPPNLIKVK
ncbi:2-hydroxyacid dehydrogenase [Bacillus pumilus]|uniref:2-hydroxyacid dehydrogenase n=1 Tax=Bacillus pumilus TaxID=1408 RepID=UPI0024900E9E|nr:D-glycerate dehydrogenase [Bacillus pumilus]